MQPTSVSLLDLLKRGEDQQAWESMVEIYQPLIKKWLVRFGAPPADVADLSQAVLMVVVRKLPGFKHAGRTGSFRTWLRNIARNCLLEFWRDKKIKPVATGKTSFQEKLNQLADETSELSQRWNQEYDQHVLSIVLRKIEGEFNSQTWTAFKRVAVDGASTAEVAEELNVSLNSVFISKSRVMTRLRAVGKHLID